MDLRTLIGRDKSFKCNVEVAQLTHFTTLVDYVMMNSIVITGCNRGLGLGLIRRLVEETNPPKNIIATYRNLDKAKVS